MYTVTVRSHMMIAHSLPDPFFGPASGLHGATYVVDAELRTAQLDAHNVVVDIELATRSLDQVLAALRYRNLDELPAFHGVLTTTEWLAAHLHRELALLLRGRFAGALKITLHESHVASASFEAELPAG